MKFSFAMDATEIVAAKDWLQKHRHRQRWPRRIAEYHFAPTNFGADRVIITCECGKSQDVSDYESW